MKKDGSRHLKGIHVLTALLTLLILSTNASAEDEITSNTSKQHTELEQPADAAAEATLFPIPDYTGGLGERAALTGDWGGIRTDLAQDNGLQFSTDVTQFYLGVLDGGRDTKWEYNGAADYRIKLDTGKAGLWPGGFLEVHGETYWGKSVNSLTGAILPVNTDLVLSFPAGEGTYLPHVVFTQFLAEDLAIIAGKLDTTVGDANRFAHGVGDQRFMNTGFSFNPVTLLSSPYSTLGAAVLWLPSEDIVMSFTAIDADGTIDQTGFDTVFNGNTTYSGEMTLSSNFFDQSGRHTFGGIYSSKEFTSLAQDPRVLVPALDAPIATEEETWALYYNFDQYLYTDPKDPSLGWGVFGRAGVSDGEANIVHQFYSIGIGGTGIIPGRERDRFGLGFYYMELSDNRLGLATDDNEHGVELFYNMALTPWFEVGADLQFINGAGRFSDSATVGGIRGRISF